MPSARSQRSRPPNTSAPRRRRQEKWHPGMSRIGRNGRLGLQLALAGLQPSQTYLRRGAAKVNGLLSTPATCTNPILQRLLARPLNSRRGGRPMQIRVYFVAGGGHRQPLRPTLTATLAVHFRDRWQHHRSAVHRTRAASRHPGASSGSNARRKHARQSGQRPAGKPGPAPVDSGWSTRMAPTTSCRPARPAYVWTEDERLVKYCSSARGSRGSSRART